MLRLGKLKIEVDRLRRELERIRSRRAALFLPEDAAEGSHLIPFYVQVMTKVIGAERCSVFILNFEKGTVWVRAGTGLEENEIEVQKADSITGRVIETGEPIMESGLENKPGHHDMIEARTGFVPRSIMCVPIRSPFRNEVTGAFEVLNKIGASAFDEDDLAVAKQVAEHLQLEVDRIFLHQETFGLTERLYSAARKAILALIVTVVGFFVVAILALVLYLAVPAVMGQERSGQNTMTPDRPLEHPQKFKPVVNLRTAGARGIVHPAFGLGPR